jgi:sigma-B regulation protein RsbU (phosphoserine phosphatase)
VLTTSSGIRYLTPPGNTAIGLVDGVDFKEQELDLSTGDTLVLYSDGVSEARIEEGAFFGEDRLLGLVKDVAGGTANSVGSAIITAVDEFIGDARQSDDLSIIVIRRR